MYFVILMSVNMMIKIVFIGISQNGLSIYLIQGHLLSFYQFDLKDFLSNCLLCSDFFLIVPESVHSYLLGFLLEKLLCQVCPSYSNVQISLEAFQELDDYVLLSHLHLI